MMEQVEGAAMNDRDGAHQHPEPKRGISGARSTLVWSAVAFGVGLALVVAVSTWLGILKPAPQKLAGPGTTSSAAPAKTPVPSTTPIPDNAKIIPPNTRQALTPSAGAPKQTEACAALVSIYRALLTNTAQNLDMVAALTDARAKATDPVLADNIGSVLTTWQSTQRFEIIPAWRYCVNTGVTNEAQLN